MRVSDSAMVLVDARSGVEVGTELVWKIVDEYKLPRMLVVSRMDRENANFEKAVESMANVLQAKVAGAAAHRRGEAFRGSLTLLR